MMCICQSVAEKGKAKGYLERVAFVVVPFLVYCMMLVGESRGDDNIGQRAVRLYEQGRYREAFAEAKRSESQSKARFGEESEVHALALSYICLVLKAQGRHGEAEDFLQRSLKIREKALGPTHTDVAESLYNLAILKRDRGALQDAKELLDRALIIREGSLGPKHPSIGATLNGLATYHLLKGDLEGATPLFERALEIRREALGPRHPDVGETINDIGLLFQKARRYTEAETFLRRGLSIREQALGSLHPDVSESLYNLGVLLAERQRYEDSARWLKRALAIKERALGAEEPAAVEVMNKLVDIYKIGGRSKQADAMQHRVWRIKERPFREALTSGKLFGRSISLVDLLLEFSRLYREDQRYAEAEQFAKRALSISEGKFGSNSPQLTSALTALALIYEDQGMYAPAEVELKRTLAIQEDALARSDDCTTSRVPAAFALRELAGLYRLAGYYTKAEPLYERADRLYSCVAFGIGTNVGDYFAVPVLFATDRKCGTWDRRWVQEMPNYRLACEADRGEAVTYGKAEVSVPRDHGVASLERPSWRDVLRVYSRSEDPARHFSVINIVALDKDSFLRSAKEQVAASKSYKGQALVFIHGYNVAFDNALYRAVQIAYDIDFDGALFVYSWPSGGGLADYLYDEESARLAEPQLRKFFELILAQSDIKTIHVVAHSMGGSLLMRVLSSLSNSFTSGISLGEIIFAAPDMDRKEFESSVQDVLKQRDRVKGTFKVTLYVSARDKALELSRKSRRDLPRAGEVTKAGPIVVNGMDTIDVTEAGMNFLSLNHSTYAESPSVLRDMRALLLKGERPPGTRTSVLRALKTVGGTYWKFPRTGGELNTRAGPVGIPSRPPRSYVTP